MFNFVQFKKMMWMSILSLSLIHCGGSSAPASNTPPLSSSSVGKSFPNITPPHSTAPSTSPVNPGASSSPGSSSVAPESNAPSEADIEAFATDFISAVCEVAHHCDTRIQLQECSRYLQNEGGGQIWDNLGVSVNSLQALVNALEAGTISVSETNLETCAGQFADQCKVENPNLMSGNYQNIENVIPDTHACNNVFVTGSSSMGGATSTSSDVPPSSTSLPSNPDSTPVPSPEIGVSSTSTSSH